MNPGATTRPAALIVERPDSGSAEIAAIRPALMPTFRTASTTGFGIHDAAARDDEIECLLARGRHGHQQPGGDEDGEKSREHDVSL